MNSECNSSDIPENVETVPNLRFLAHDFMVDNEKGLFKSVDGTKIFVGKVKKNIFEITQVGSSFAFIDLFGDCYMIEQLQNNESYSMKFVFGILSSPTFFTFFNNRFYSIDKFGRVWVHDTDGEILNIYFVNQNIIDVIIKEDYCAVTTDNNPIVLNYYKDRSIDGDDMFSKESIKAKPSKLFIFDRSFDLLRSEDIDCLVECTDRLIKVQYKGEEIEHTIKDHNARKSLRAGDL